MLPDVPMILLSYHNTIYTLLK